MTSSSRITGTFLVHLFYFVAFLQSCHAALNYLADGDTHNINFIVNLTKHLHKKHCFNGFVSFGENRDSDWATNRFTNTLEPALAKSFGLPIIVWGEERNGKLRQNIGLNNLVIVNFASINDTILDVVDYMLEGLHYMPMLFIYKSVDNAPLAKQQIHDFFSWCWDKNIVNVALTFEDHSYNQVYKYSPFPVINVINVTNLIYTDDGDFIFDHITNTRGYHFKTPIQSNPPYVILVPSRKVHYGNSEYSISGLAGRLYEEFTQHINGTVMLMPQHNMTPYSFYYHNFFEAAKKHIDISVHSYSELPEYTKLTEGSYPIGWTNFCIILPVVNEVKKSDYLILASMTSSRYLSLGLLLSLALLQVLSNKPFYISLRRIGQAIWNSIGMLLLQALPLTQMQNRRSRFAFFYVLAIFLSLMLVSIYTASLTALFSKVVLGRQIKTVEELLQSNLKILVYENERQNYFESGHLPAALMGHLHITDPETVAEHRDSLNTSYAYVATSHMWTMLNMKQSRLSMPRFRVAGSEFCTPPIFLRFPVQWDSPFQNTLTLFFMYTQASGLPLKWEKETTRQIVEMKLIDIIEDMSVHPVPISISHLENFFGLCVIMWICSVLCFFGELFWHWWSVKWNRRSDRRQQQQLRLRQINIY